MSLNFIAEKSNKINWEDLHKDVYREDLLIELVPMVECEINGGDAVGICIPQKKISEKAWKDLKDTLLIFNKKYVLEIVDMYSGNKVETSSLEDLKMYFEEE